MESHHEERPAAQVGEKTAVRFAFLDGLRGLAALSIVIFHAWWYEPSPHSLLDSAHWFFDAAFLRSRRGVQLLLVVSGFVIAYSLRNTWATPREMVLFVGRRIVRLVPTYWLTIGLVILVDFLCRGPLKLPSLFEGDPSVPRVLAHLAFLQDVFDHEALSAGLWTVCIEVQFYIVAVLGWGLAQRILARPVNDHPRPASSAVLAVFAPLAIVSLVYWYPLESGDHWVTFFLWRFFLGMITWWTLDRTIPVAFFITIMAIASGHLVFELAINPLSEWQPSANNVALMTALAIFIAGRRERLHVWLNWRWLQFFGRISYSLYLIHFPVSHVLITAGWKWCDNSPTSAQAALIFSIALAASLLGGYMLYVFVEAPSVRWAAKLKHRTEVVVS